MLSHWPRISLVGLVLTAIGVGVLVAWALWPAECGHTAIVFEPGQPDPNLHACTTRIGTIVSLDAARVSAVLWGQAAGASVLLAGSMAAWSRGWLRARPRVSRGTLRGVGAILGRGSSVWGGGNDPTAAGPGLRLREAPASCSREDPQVRAR